MALSDREIENRDRERGGVYSDPFTAMILSPTDIPAREAGEDISTWSTNMAPRVVSQPPSNLEHHKDIESREGFKLKLEMNGIDFYSHSNPPVICLCERHLGGHLQRKTSSQI